ncbi:g11494 [Coccomyxa elongata]
MGATENILSALLPERAGTEGVSPSVLQEYLDRLDARKTQVLDAFLEQLSDQTTLDSLTTSGKTDAVLAGVASHEEALGRELAGLAKQHCQLSAQLEEAEKAAQAVHVLADLQQRLQDFDAHLATGEFVEAAQCVAELAQPAHPHLDGEARQQREFAAEQRSATLLQTLASKARRLLVADADACQLEVADSRAAGQVWRALQILQHLEEHLQFVGEHLLSQALLPMVTAPSPIMRTLQRDGDGDAKVVQWRPDEATPAQDGSVEDALLTVLRFVAEAACGGDREIVVLLGAILWPRLAPSYIEARLSPAVPEDDSQLEGFQATCKNAQRFEAQAASMGFVPQDEEGRGRIGQWVRHALDRFLHAKRLRVVTAARDALMAPEAADTLEAGVALPVNPEAVAALKRAVMTGQADGADAEEVPLNWGPEGEEGPLLATGRYRITHRAEALVAVMRGALEEAVRSGSPAVAQSLAAAVQDVAELAGALLPSVRARKLQVPQPAALFHNDCQHVAAQLLSLPYLFAPRLAQLAPSAPSQFIDAALRLRAAGTAVLEAQAERQAREVADVLSAAQGFSRLHVAQRGITARKVVQQALHALRRLGDMLGSVLAPRDFVRVAAAVVQALAHRAVGELLALEDISVEESEDLPRILGPLADDAPAAALGRAGALEQAPADRDLILAAIEARAPALAKLREVLFVMGARLVQIDERWKDGGLQKAGLSSDEVVHLIEALFEDTDLRREVLHNIRSG